MTTTTSIERSHKTLADELIADLDESYELVYVDRGDRLTDEQVAAIVACDFDSLWGGDLGEWESDQRADRVHQIIRDDAEEIVRHWEIEDDADYSTLLHTFDHTTEEWERVREAIDDREAGNWMNELCNNTNPVLLRVRVLDEDTGYDNEIVHPERVLRDVGLPVTDDNVRIMRATLNECSPEFSVLLGYWVAGVRVRDMYELTNEPNAQIEIVNPYLYLGNPLQGTGWMSEEPFQGVATVRRGDLRTDKAAFGHSLDSIFGGLNAGSLACEIRTVPQRSAGGPA